MPSAIRRCTTWATRVAVGALLVALCASSSGAGHVPAPGLCEVDPCFVACPAGDSLDRVLLRRWDFTPDEFIEVRVSLCGCPDVHLAPPSGNDAYGLDSACVLTMITDLEGIADFRPRAGGVCSGVPILVTGYSLPVAYRYSWASPDQDGDLVVSPGDMAAIEQKIGTSDRTADFDCDGAVTAADLAIAESHLGHSAFGPVGVPIGDGADATRLSQSWPNPCDGHSTIAFRLAGPERVTLAIYDMTGRLVAAPLREVWMGSGPHQVAFDSEALATGVYVYRLRAGRFEGTRRMIVAR
jgi:hypothetical protein